MEYKRIIKDEKHDFIVLAERNNINCAELSVEEFCKYIAEDMKIADEIYNCIKKAEFEQFHSDMPAYMLDREIRCAKRKWKSDKRIAQHINEVHEKWINMSYEPYEFWADFEVNPYQMGIPDDCILHANDSIDKLIRCFNYLSPEPYFKKALGWKIGFDTDTGRFGLSGRPYVEIILNDEDCQSYDADVERHNNNVLNFYKDCKYWGD